MIDILRRLSLAGGFMDPRPALRLLSALVGLLALPLPALAGGFEHQALSAPALGRGGAYAAAVDDPMALLYNPAQLSAVPGTQLTVGANLPLYNSCFARAGADPSTGSAYPEVCNGASPFPAPYVALALQPIAKLGIGVGILPPAGVAGVRYGRGDGTMVGPNGDVVPTPSRYLLIERNTPLFFPTVGASYEVLPWLRLGASFGWGIAMTSFATTISGFGTEMPASDVISRASGGDMFVPRIGGSVHMVPHENVDVMLGFSWTQDIRANVDLELDSPLLMDEVIEGARLTTPQPVQLSLGIRYADRIRPRSEPENRRGRSLTGEVNDRMANERWDVEANVVYERNSRIDAVRVTMPRDEMGNPPQLLNSDVEDVVLPHRWKDQITLRLGGDWNVVPGIFSVRSGLSFESNGVTRGFEQLSFRPGRRVGLHAGMTVRIAQRVDVALAYAHLFEQSVTLGLDEAQLRAEVGIGTMEGFITNAGRFTSSYNVLSLGANIHF
jgi:hypothetical protein